MTDAADAPLSPSFLCVSDCARGFVLLTRLFLPASLQGEGGPGVLADSDQRWCRNPGGGGLDPEPTSFLLLRGLVLSDRSRVVTALVTTPAVY